MQPIEQMKAIKMKSYEKVETMKHFCSVMETLNDIESN